MPPLGKPLGGPMAPLGGPIMPGGRAMSGHARGPEGGALASIPGPEGIAPPGAPPKMKGPAGWKRSVAEASLFLTWVTAHRVRTD